LVSESCEVGGSIGYQLRRLRGLTQEELADRANVSRDLVAKLEQGRRQTARISSLVSFARALDVELSELVERAMPGLETEDGAPMVSGTIGRDVPELSFALGGCAPRDAVSVVERLVGDDVALSLAGIAQLVHEWLVVEPPQLAEPRAGRRIGTGLVDRVERRVEQLRHIDDFVGGRDLHDLVARELRVTIGLLKSATYTDELGRRLLIAVGELCQLAGWVASDAGLRGAAQRYYLAAMRAAEGAGDRPLAGQAISSLAYQAASGDDARTAVVLARSAYEGARGTATAATQALLLERVAWAHARAGEFTQTERALDAVDRAFEERLPADDPPWVYWLDRDEIDVMAGRCYTELRRPVEAVPLLSAVLERYGDTRAREAALYTSWLAESHLQAGEIDRAGATAIRLLELGDRVNSARSDERLAYLRRALGPHRDVASVRAFDERYRSHRDLSD
jgi:DNA-binding Xre family transcriptional regulator/tetratricopeptide (TPR) repeat protein